MSMENEMNRFPEGSSEGGAETGASTGNRIRISTYQPGDRLNETLEAGRERMGQMRDQAQQQWSRFTDAAQAGWKQMQDSLEQFRGKDFTEVVDQGREMVRKYPERSVLAAVGVGLLVGLMLRNRNQ